MMRPLGRDRWSFLHNADHGDQLVHSALAMYNPTYKQRGVMVVPALGITECGIYIKLLDDMAAVAEQGVYLDDKHTVTCMRCASGVCSDGISFRQTVKEALFGERYGRKSYNMPVQGSAAMIRGHRAHRTVIDEVQNIDYATIETQCAEVYKRLMEAYKIPSEWWMAAALAKPPDPP